MKKCVELRGGGGRHYLNGRAAFIYIYSVLYVHTICIPRKWHSSQQEKKNTPSHP